MQPWSKFIGPVGMVPVPGPQQWQGMDDLIRRVAEYLQNEVNASAFYEELMAMVSDQTARSYIRHAMEDEQKHYRMLARLYRELTGRTPQITPQRTEFASLREGLIQAMNNEYEAFEEYRRTYLDYPAEQLRNLFFELMTDELEHATRFNYALQTL